MRTRTTLALLLMLPFTTSCIFNVADGPLFDGADSLQAESSQLVVYRPAVNGYDRTFSLSVDGEDQAVMLMGGYSTLAVAPGAHVVRTEMDSSFRAWLPGIILIILPVIIYNEMNPPGEFDLNVDFKAGQTIYVRFEPGDTLELVPAAEALRELAECRRQD